MELQVALGAGGSRRAALERELREAVRSGRLRAGAALPASRVLAAQLAVSRGVVVEAYSQLVAEGYLVARQGSGTEVATGVAETPAHRPAGARRRPAIRYELRSGLCDVSRFPRRAWQAAGARALRELPDAALSYGNPQGQRRLRAALADQLARTRGVVATADRVVVCPGLGHGLSLVWGVLRARGARRAAVEDPGWPGHSNTVTHVGLEAVPVRVDEDGLVVGDLEGLDVDAVVVTPAHQYPTGVVMAPERRSALVEWARRGDKLIVEDDYDAEYRYDRDPVAALQGLAPERVVYSGTASKTLAPALRVGWLLAPDGLVDEVAAEHAVTGPGPPAIEQATLAILLERGEVDRHLRRTRRLYRVRRDVLAGALADALPAARIGGAAAGLHLVAWLPEDGDEAAIARAAHERGVAIHTLHGDCAVVAPAPAALLLGYASLGEDALRRAARELGLAASAAGPPGA